MLCDFKPKEAKAKLKLVEDYRHTFKGVGKVVSGHQLAVLVDLAKFCHIEEQEHGSDQVLHTKILGRQEMFNRMIKHLDYPSEWKNQLTEALMETEQDER